MLVSLSSVRLTLRRTNLRRFVQIVDDFYPNPEQIRQKALEMSYSEPEALVGWRTEAYQPNGIRSLLERKFGVNIKFWETDVKAVDVCNGVFFSAFAKGSRAETVGVHSDDPPDWMMVLVYLSPGAPYDSGTSIWQHGGTGLIARPTRRDAVQLGMTLGKLEARLVRDSQKPSRWVEVDRIGNVYNRAVMFSGGFFHSATKHFGSNSRNGRLYQSFHFPITATQRNGKRR
jgi:Family of unknown function (DUF6445)